MLKFVYASHVLLTDLNIYLSNIYLYARGMQWAMMQRPYLSYTHIHIYILYTVHIQNLEFVLYFMDYMDCLLKDSVYPTTSLGKNLKL